LSVLGLCAIALGSNAGQLLYWVRRDYRRMFHEFPIESVPHQSWSANGCESYLRISYRSQIRGSKRILILFDGVQQVKFIQYLGFA